MLKAFKFSAGGDNSVDNRSMGKFVKNKAILRLGINLTVDDALFKNVLEEIVRKVKS